MLRAFDLSLCTTFTRIQILIELQLNYFESQKVSKTNLLHSLEYQQNCVPLVDRQVTDKTNANRDLVTLQTIIQRLSNGLKTTKGFSSLRIL